LKIKDVTKYPADNGNLIDIKHKKLHLFGQKFIQVNGEGVSAKRNSRINYRSRELK